MDPSRAQDDISIPNHRLKYTNSMISSSKAFFDVGRVRKLGNSHLPKLSSASEGFRLVRLRSPSETISSFTERSRSEQNIHRFRRKRLILRICYHFVEAAVICEDAMNGVSTRNFFIVGRVSKLSQMLLIIIYFYFSFSSFSNCSTS